MLCTQKFTDCTLSIKSSKLSTRPNMSSICILVALSVSKVRCSKQETSFCNAKPLDLRSGKEERRGKQLIQMMGNSKCQENMWACKDFVNSRKTGRKGGLQAETERCIAPFCEFVKVIARTVCYGFNFTDQVIKIADSTHKR